MRAFGDHLRLWRRERSISQLSLAAAADTSARHLSFLESGRSAPSRVMVLRLSEALGVSPEERDRALESAGFSPSCRRASLDETDASAVERAIAALLDGHGPMPAFVLDADWTLIDRNAGGERLLRVLDPHPSRSVSEGRATGAADGAQGPGLIDLLVSHADGRVIADWPALAARALARARAEQARHRRPLPAFDAAVERLAAAHLSYRGGEGAPARGDRRPHGRGDGEVASVIVPLRVELEGTTLSLLSMIAQFGGVEYLDVTVPTVELMFAADEPTRRWFETG